MAPKKYEVRPEWVTASLKDTIPHYEAATDPHCKRLTKSRAFVNRCQEDTQLAAVDHETRNRPVSNDEGRQPQKDQHVQQAVKRQLSPQHHAATQHTSQAAATPEQSLTRFARAGGVAWSLGDDDEFPEVGQDLNDAVELWEPLEMEIMKIWTYVGVQSKALQVALEEERRAAREEKIRSALEAKERRKLEQALKAREEKARLAEASKNRANEQKAKAPKPPPKNSKPSSAQGRNSRPNSQQKEQPSSSKPQKAASPSKRVEPTTKAAPPPQSEPSGSSTPKKEPQQTPLANDASKSNTPRTAQSKPQSNATTPREQQKPVTPREQSKPTTPREAAKPVSEKQEEKAKPVTPREQPKPAAEKQEDKAKSQPPSNAATPRTATPRQSSNPPPPPPPAPAKSAAATPSTTPRQDKTPKPEPSPVKPKQLPAVVASPVKAKDDDGYGDDDFEDTATSQSSKHAAPVHNSGNTNHPAAAATADTYTDEFSHDSGRKSPAYSDDYEKSPPAPAKVAPPPAAKPKPLDSTDDGYGDDFTDEFSPVKDGPTAKDRNAPSSPNAYEDEFEDEVA